MRVVGILAEGVLRVDSGTYGLQLWTRCKLRKSKKCGSCGQQIGVRDQAYRPITNAGNRMDRLCVPCSRITPRMEENRFEEIASEAIRQAEAVDCSLPEFRDGLKAVIEALQERYDQVCAEIG